MEPPEGKSMDAMELERGYGEPARQALTPRQDRLEGRIVTVLATHGTRSELRELVHEFADFLRMQGATAERAVSLLRTLGARAMPAMESGYEWAVGDSADDRMAMMVRWCTARFSRDD
jgi:hypothetical protein